MTEPDQQPENDARPLSRLFGLVMRKERWTLSLRGWLAVLVCLGSVGAFVAWGLHPFLAVNRPVDGEFLVIEGWIPGYAVEEGMKEFQAHKYGRFFTTGGPSRGDAAAEAYPTLAELAATHLKKLGLPPEVVEPIRSPAVIRDRTYSSAVGLRKWFEEHRVSVKAVNVMTVGTHARRSRLMFEKALDGKVAVGIIAIQNQAYDPKRWWKSSEGTKETISEAVAYLYARLFFHP